MMADRHLNKCVDCAKRDVRQNYRDKIEEKHAYDKKRSRRPERRAYAREALRRHRQRNPLKYKARNAVNNALRDGRLRRQGCEIKGCGKRAQARHEDYHRPLDVRWRCFQHHRELHGQEPS
jgi:hypothetical protein